MEDLRKLNRSENVGKEKVQQWINNGSKFGCYEALSGNRMSFRIQKKKEFRKIPKNYEEKFVTPSKLSHNDAFVHTEAFTLLYGAGR